MSSTDALSHCLDLSFLPQPDVEPTCQNNTTELKGPPDTSGGLAVGGRAHSSWKWKWFQYVQLRNTLDPIQALILDHLFYPLHLKQAGTF